MIVNCEACGKRYLVDETVLGVSGRMLKCAACGHRWRQMAPRPEKDIVEALTPDGPSLSQEKEKKGLFSFILLLFFLIGVFLGGGYFARQQVMTTWPKTQKIYHLFGLESPPPSSRLVLKNVMPLDFSKEGETFKKMVVRGEFFNPTDSVENLNSLTIKIEGDCEQASWYEKTFSKVKGIITKSPQACIVSSWQHNLVETRILPGGHITFETEVKDLPSSAHKVQIHY